MPRNTKDFHTGRELARTPQFELKYNELTKMRNSNSKFSPRHETEVDDRLERFGTLTDTLEQKKKNKVNNYGN